VDVSERKETNVNRGRRAVRARLAVQAFNGEQPRETRRTGPGKPESLYLGYSTNTGDVGWEPEISAEEGVGRMTHSDIEKFGT